MEITIQKVVSECFELVIQTVDWHKKVSRRKNQPCHDLEVLSWGVTIREALERIGYQENPWAASREWKANWPGTRSSAESLICLRGNEDLQAVTKKSNRQHSPWNIQQPFEKELVESWGPPDTCKKAINSSTEKGKFCDQIKSKSCNEYEEEIYENSGLVQVRRWYNDTKLC